MDAVEGLDAPISKVYWIDKDYYEVRYPQLAAYCPKHSHRICSRTSYRISTS